LLVLYFLETSKHIFHGFFFKLKKFKFIPQGSFYKILETSKHIFHGSFYKLLKKELSILLKIFFESLKFFP